MDRVLVVLDRLKELGSIASLSYSDKTEIEQLYKEVLDKKFVHTSCNDCYRDAIIEMRVYLKKNGSMKEKSEYALKNGVLLQMEFGKSEFYTNANMTDEVAEKYLGKYPDGIKLFSKKPDDWEERVQKKQSPKINEELVTLMVEALNDGVSQDSLKDEFASYKLNGKTISKRSLDQHIKKAVLYYAEAGEQHLEEGDNPKEDNVIPDEDNKENPEEVEEKQTE